MAPTRLPGFGLPLDYIYTREYTANEEDNVERANLVGFHIFPKLLSALAYRGSVLPLTTLREFTMMRFMNEITDKPDWHEKMKNSEIVAKWRSEMLSAKLNGVEVSERMADWCIEELKYKAQEFECTGSVSIYRGDVVKSDTAVPFHLKEALKIAVMLLEGVSPAQRDWHPDSDEKVLDLVHPSLFPLVYGRSKILPDGQVGLDDCIRRSDEGVTIPIRPSEEGRVNWVPLNDPYSHKFQWLPCDVDISDAEHPRITSYVNNLHPVQHRGLYSLLEQIIACAIPLWNTCLTPLKAGTFRYPRIIYEMCKYDREFENIPDEEGPQRDLGEDWTSYTIRRKKWHADTQHIVQPEPPSTFRPFQVPDNVSAKFFIAGTTSIKPERTVDLSRDYKNSGIQVIVKLVNIHLTPEKPAYEGGSWHVEGQLNEHICASAVYYYDSVNITTSRLAFRQYSDVRDVHRVRYSYDQHDWLRVVFGCKQHGPGLQDVGSVNTSEGRLLVWPNILQHKVQPFRLADPSKSGHRKVLAVFLVDPNARIISTANVPCQRRDWWYELVKERSDALSSLPVELQDLIFNEIDGFAMSFEEAKELRLQLIAEHKAYVADCHEAIHKECFSLYEH